MDLNEVRLEIKEDLAEINQRIQSLEKHTMQYQILFSEHTKQDVKMCDAIEEFRDNQTIMVGQLGDYNGQLKVHISGVQELKVMNSNLVKYIQSIRDDVDKELAIVEGRLVIAEGPTLWWASTKKTAYLVWSIIAALGAAYAFYFQTWITRPNVKAPIPVTPITKILHK